MCVYVFGCLCSQKREEEKVLIVYIYFFLSVKKDFRFDSSFCEEAGKVIDRLSPLAALWHCVLRAPTHWFISASSCACRRNSAPVESLWEKWMEEKNYLWFKLGFYYLYLF